MLAAQLAGKAMIEIADRVDRSVGQGLLEEDGLMGEPDIEEPPAPLLYLHDPLDRVEQKLVAPVMET